MFRLNGRPFFCKRLLQNTKRCCSHVLMRNPELQMTCALKPGTVANDLFIKAKASCGWVKQSSFSGLRCSGLHSIPGAQ